MDLTSRVSAAIAYLPVIGWLYVIVFQRRNAFALFHLRQSIGLFLFLVGVLVGWAVITWLLAWLPFLFIVGNALFSLVIAAYVYGAIAWVIGIFNALRSRAVLLPVFGRRANQLPI